MAVRVSNLSKTFGAQVAVDNVSFELRNGEIVGFLGPNGAGKSTTMKMLTGYLKPTSGSIEVEDNPVTERAMQARAAIGYLPEHNPLYTDMYVREFLLLVGDLYGMERKLRNERVEEMISLCGLTKERRKKIGQLSKGYRQRVGLAQALLNNPAVLILDEPTTGLDPNQLVEIREVIRKAGKDKTVLLSSHIMQEVEALCDRVIVIHHGKIISDSTLDELRSRGQSLEEIFRSLTQN
jgi:ABC-2 type transport system ATP-binding protein